MARKSRVKFGILGVREIRKAYQNLPKKVANKVVRQAVRTSLKPMHQAAKQDAPKGETGLLKRSMKLRVRAKKKRGTIAMDVRTGDGDFKGATYYGGMVNFGTKRQPAQRFMERAFDATRSTATKTARRLIREGTAREWKQS